MADNIPSKMRNTVYGVGFFDQRNTKGFGGGLQQPKIMGVDNPLEKFNPLSNNPTPQHT